MTNLPPLDPEPALTGRVGDSVGRRRLESACRVAREALLAERTAAGHWVGELSTSALATATATMALSLFRRAVPEDPAGERIDLLLDAGCRWLVDHQNEDGGWGDTIRNVSNISTTMLAHAVLVADGAADQWLATILRAESYIESAGGSTAVLARYGRDRTFSVPILTHCALAGTVDWQQVIPLPFELACLPHAFYKTVRLPVVSYALPALIAIGLARFAAAPPRNPLVRLLRRWARRPALRKLERIQPSNGGFLEAAPLTSFVTMSLASCGLADHVVTRRGVDFLVASARPDGGWPIDTNLATWVTTLSVNALGEDLPRETRGLARDWLLGQQYRGVHPYTHAEPGGWAWTDLPGGVPDADDTPGAVLALLRLADGEGGREAGVGEELGDSVAAAVGWLLDLQNRDGGWPTFCRGWGTLPFDRSSPDITAHVLRALLAANRRVPLVASRTSRAVWRGFAFLRRTQRPDGAWVPLWFGNQHVQNDENPVYGTARVLAAWRDAGRDRDPAALRGRDWLLGVQNDDGGWGGAAGAPSSVEETALAVEAVLGDLQAEKSVREGLDWLIQRVENGTWMKATPIGFYFARLWYFEKLFPLIFTVAALRRACRVAGDDALSPPG